MTPFHKPILRWFFLSILGLTLIFLTPLFVWGDVWGLTTEFKSIWLQSAAILPILLVIALHLRGNLDLRGMVRPSSKPFRWQGLILLLVLIFFGAYSIDNLTTVGLSYLMPEYVEDKLGTPLLPWEDGIWPVIFTIVIAGVIAPIMEELIFRGFILNRFLVKYNASNAVIFSSILFGILHFEAFLSALIFSAIMCLLYLHTHSLWVPIIVHVCNNLLVLAQLFITTAGRQEVNLAEFRGDWIFYLLALLALPGLGYFLKTFWIKDMTKIPYELEMNEVEADLEEVQA